MRNIMPRLIRTITLSAVVAASFSVFACHRGPAEETGKKVDDAIDRTTQGHEEPIKKGPAQKAGEDIDKATGNH
jgi:hypothetical protein